MQTIRECVILLSSLESEMNDIKYALPSSLGENIDLDEVISGLAGTSNNLVIMLERPGREEHERYIREKRRSSESET
jgi:hypothetical protein